MFATIKNGGIVLERLARIKSIDNFRFFSAYRWNNSLKPFGRFNLIYGWNGCGKSTLSDFFHIIESAGDLPAKCNFQLCFQEDHKAESVYTVKTVQAVANRFKVYHQGYAQGLISHPGDVKHISIIGHDAGETVLEIERLKKERALLEGELFSMEQNATALLREFESYRKERASLVRSVTSYNQSYNYNKIYERYQQVKNPSELTQVEYDQLTVAVRATPKSPVQTPYGITLDKTIINDVECVLSESPVFTFIEQLQENRTLRDWVQRGYEVHKTSQTKICEFCHSPIPPDRWSDLENYFNDSLSNFKKHIEAVLLKLNSLRGQYVEYSANLPHKEQLFDEFAVEYEKYKSDAKAFCEACVEFIDSTIKLVKVKSDRIIDTQCATEFSVLLDSACFTTTVFDDISTIVKKHNSKADDFRKSIAKDEERLELHIIAQSASRFSSYEAQLSENAESAEQLRKKINKIALQIIDLDDRVRNSRIPADTINSDIGFIFGHSDLHFEWKENGYEIKRNNEIATFLSTGEQNAIALIYFFNSLQDSNVSKNDCIVILDDPVSSFDSNYYYSAAAYIRDKLESVGQSFIFTHKFSLYKDFSRMFSECHRYLLERECNLPAIKAEDAFLRDYQDEYVYLFYKIYHFANNPPQDLSDYLPYPNMGRRLLEAFITFKVPGSGDILAKAIELDGNNSTARVRAITRLVQNQSHLRLIGTHDRAENILDIQQLPSILQKLLEFIDVHDHTHYTALVEQVDAEHVYETPPMPLHTERTIPLFDLVVSAGLGNRLESYESSEPFTTRHPTADFALKISGDSMEPQFSTGDIVLVKKQNTLDNAQIGIVAVDGEAFCKKVVTTNATPMLVSLNKKYAPRQILPEEQFEIFGVVIEKVEPETK